MHMKNDILRRKEGQTSFRRDFQSIAKELAGLKLIPSFSY